jgi:LysM repeat protein
VANYSRSAYGSGNVNAGKPANGDFGAWGGYKWPNCAPASLLGTTNYTNKFGQRLRVQLRSGIVELATLIFQIADKHNYCVYSNYNGENWGPWGMDCRPISGSNNPSGHSGGLAMDWNAPRNAYSTTFQSDMPPAMVADIEACGWYWGGRYTGKYDAMHFSYCWAPSDVARHTAKARAILGGSAVVTPPPTGDDSMSAAEVKQLSDQITALTNLLFTPDARGPGHELRPEVAYATKQIQSQLSDIKDEASQEREQIAGKVAEVRERVLYPGARWDNFQDIVARLNLIMRALNIPVPEGPVPDTPPPATTYTVKAGDTLGAIAKATGKTVADLVAWNKLTNPDAISEGQVLRLTAP